MATTETKMAERVLAWYRHHGRHDLPWQRPRSPYRVWLSEVMLQQTQVATVIPYFQRFIEHFPDLRALAQAQSDQVMALWAGLGYYSRARNLQRSARLCVEDHDGELPRDLDQLIALPGIGRSTAGAILALSHGQRHAILDGNVKRVLARYHAIPGWPGRSAVLKELWQRAEQNTPHRQITDYTQAIMDLGATLCTPRQPACGQCPLATDCQAKAQGRAMDYPGKKPAKTRPQRHQYVLMVRGANGALLLERRPPSGIWGSLWSLPLANDAPAERHLAGPPLQHGFTHFKLKMTPLLLSVTDFAPTIGDSAQRWCDDRACQQLGLPRPIQTLINDYFAEQIPWQEPSIA